MNNQIDENKIRTEKERTEYDETSIEELRSMCDEFRNSAEEQKKKAEEYLHNLKGLKAEFDNYRKREKQNREIFVKSSNKDLIMKLLPVLDDMDNAIQEIKKNDVHRSFLEGIELIYRKFISILEKEGVRRIEALGKKFDPKYHDAVMTISSPDYEDYEIVDELRKGYILHDEVIRAAQVSVNRWEKKENEE